MKSGLNGIMVIDVKGVEDFKRCVANVMHTMQQLDEATSELKECGLDINCNLDFGNGVCSEGVISIENEDASFEDTQFGREDLEDMISDLHEEYYKLGRGKNVDQKIAIVNSIERLCRLRETMKE